MPSDWGSPQRPARPTTPNTWGAPPRSTAPALPQMPAMPGGGQPNWTSANTGQPIAPPSAAPAAAPAAPVAAPGGSAVAPPPPPMVNNATPSPELQRADAQYQERLKQLQQGKGTDPNQQFLIDKFKGQLSADNSQGLIDRESFRIADQAAAMKAGMTNESGRAGSGAGGADSSRIDSRAMRMQAGAANDIGLAQQARTDALVLGGRGLMSDPANMELQREQNLSQFTLNGLPYAESQPRLALAQQGLGLAQWNAQANYGLGAASLAQQGNIAAGNQNLSAAQMQQQAAMQQAQMQQAQQQAYWQMLMRTAGY